jgi:hypothetical protein
MQQFDILSYIFPLGLTLAIIGAMPFADVAFRSPSLVLQHTTIVIFVLFQAAGLLVITVGLACLVSNYGTDET